MLFDDENVEAYLDADDNDSFRTNIDRYFTRRVNEGIAGAYLSFIFGCWSHTKVDFPETLDPILLPNEALLGGYDKKAFSKFCEYSRGGGAEDPVKLRYALPKSEIILDFRRHDLFDRLFYRTRSNDCKAYNWWNNIRNVHIEGYRNRGQFQIEDKSQVDDYTPTLRKHRYSDDSKLIKQLLAIWILEQLYNSCKWKDTMETNTREYATPASRIPSKIADAPMLARRYRDDHEWVSEAEKKTYAVHIDFVEQQHINQDSQTMKRFLDSDRLNNQQTVDNHAGLLESLLGKQITTTANQSYHPLPFLKHNWGGTEVQIVSNKMRIKDEDGDLWVLPSGTTIAISVPDELRQGADFAVGSHLRWVCKVNEAYCRIALPHQLVSQLDNPDHPMVYMVIDRVFLDSLEEELGMYLDNQTIITVGADAEHGNLEFYVMLT